MVTVKISKAVAAEFVRLELAGFPTEEGFHQVERDTAFELLGYAKEAVKSAGTTPTMKTAFAWLSGQIEEALKDVSHAKQQEEFISLAREDILIEDQIRTVFDQASIEELAEDIRANGLIQPITVRQSVTTPGKWLLVAGERRIRACEIAGVPIMARVVKADKVLARRIQLSENIHREDLSLEDKARAVRELYDELGTMQAVADLVKKSKAWVSKHVAVTEPDFGWRARRLLEEGACEDLELLGTLSKIEKSCTWSDAEEAIKRFNEGDLNREEAREFLRSRGEAEAKRRQEREAEDQRRQAEWKARQEARAAEKEAQGSQAPAVPEKEYLSPQQALLNLVKFYVVLRDQEHQGETYRVATEVSTMPYAGEGEGEAFQAFKDEEIKQAWRDALDGLADWGEDVMTEAYFKDMAGIAE